MYDTALWPGGVNIFLILAIGIVGIVSVRWMMAQLRGSRDRMQATDALKVGDLSFELKTVTDWHQLGTCLGLQTDELKQIELDYQGNERRKKEMLDLWLRRKPNAGWRDVVSALKKMEENAVAERIRQNYVRGGESTAHSSHEDSDTVGIAKRNKQKMEAKFAMLLTNTCRKLKEKQINFEDLQTFLISCFPPGECIPRSSNINGFFEAITRHQLWDYWNYYPLEGIVLEFAPDDPEITSQIESYRQDLESYKVVTKLIHHIESPAKYDKRYYQPLLFKVKTEFTDHTLKYIDDLWNKFSNLHDLPPRVALLDSIHKGCVSIIWLIPSHLAPQIHSATPLCADFYRKHEITRVELGEECIYQEKEEHQKDDHQRELEKMQDEMKLMKEEHENELQELKEKMKEEHKKEQEKMKEKHEKELQALKDEMRGKHEKELPKFKGGKHRSSLREQSKGAGEPGSPLHKAAREGNMDTLKHLAIGTDVNIKDDDEWTPLHVAAERGHMEMVKYLIGQGGNINMKDKNEQTPLHIAARENYERTVECIVDQGADINMKDNDGHTPLHIAAGKGYTRTTEYLVAKEADINIKDNDGKTPLHIATENGHPYTVKALAAKPADVNAKDNGGQTSLHIAAGKGYKHTLECLIECGADINIKDNDGMVPLHVAARGGRIKAVELLEAADVNVKDNNGRTSLHLATKGGHALAVKSLLDKGADINITDKDRKTPLDVAVKRGHANVVQILTGAGMSDVHREGETQV